MTDAQIELIKLCQRIVDMDAKVNRYLQEGESQWDKLQNANGTDCEKDIKAIVSRAKRTLKKYTKAK